MNGNCRPPKLRGLEKLRAMGVSVPPFCVVPLWRAKARKMSCKLEAALNSLGETPCGVSVRSAALQEDQQHNSQAGRFVSFNGIIGEQAILHSVQNLIRSFDRACIPETERFVILQTTHPAYFGGVAFREGCGRREKAVVEGFYGSCRSIVDGMVRPYRAVFRNREWHYDFGEACRHCACFISHRKNFIVPRHKLVPGLRLQPLREPFPSQSRLLLLPRSEEWSVYGYPPKIPPSALFASLCDDILVVSRELDDGAGVDLEWGASVDERLTFYQYRPLTRPIAHFLNRNRTRPPRLRKGSWLSGVCTCRRNGCWQGDIESREGNAEAYSPAHRSETLRSSSDSALCWRGNAFRWNACSHRYRLS